jgi:FkbM family methyltransferase
MGIFAAFNRLKPCRHGLLLYNFHDTYVGRSLDLYGEWSEGELELLGQVLRPGMVVVEVGANIGAHTVFLAQAVGPAGQVWAMEPQRILYQTLCANLALNSITNVHALNTAAAAAPGELIVPQMDYHQEGNFGGLDLGRHVSGERVPAATIDGMAFAQCGLLKIDVEGMEQAVLEGAQALIARCKPLLYLENDRPDKSAELIRRIDGLGYTLFWHRTPLFNPTNFFGNPDNVFPGVGSLNMLCVPKDRDYHVNGQEPICVPPA